MQKDQIDTLKTLLAEPKKIVIVPHKNPDGDALGSTLGLYQFLRKQGHDATVVAPNDYPKFLKWLPAEDTIIKFDQENGRAIRLIEEAELIFTLDFNSLPRTGDMEKPLANAKAKYIMIDHHQQPDDYAVVTLSDVTASSTCEMVYRTLAALDGTDMIDQDIATCLYTGIMTDTGSFRFSACTAATHRVIADLIGKGADHTFIHQQIYDANSETRMQLLGTALSNLKVLSEYKTAYITLTQEELDRHDYQKGDTEGFVNYGLAVDGVVLAFIFIENEQEGIIKISLRSKGDFSVNEMSRKYFSGGGHTNAAGGKSDLNMQETIEKLLEILPEYKAELHA
ncbi:MAG: bifunctional oligoribonuclease/PAP phosphatase NrnA [Leeuwenhoekiella sp.]